MVQSDNRFLFEIGKTPEYSQCSLLGLLLLPCGILRNPNSNKLWLSTISFLALNRYQDPHRHVSGRIQVMHSAMQTRIRASYASRHEGGRYEGWP